jgi:hypothetical protein
MNMWMLVVLSVGRSVASSCSSFVDTGCEWGLPRKQGSFAGRDKDVASSAKRADRRSGAR